jgi:hypothetical protein
MLDSIDSQLFSLGMDVNFELQGGGMDAGKIPEQL